MKSWIISATVILQLLSLQNALAIETKKVVKENNSYVIETSDIANFWEAYDAAKTADEKGKVFKALYQERASAMFKEQLKHPGDMRSVRKYLESFEKYPKYWESVRNPTMAMKDLSQEIDASFKVVEEIYPRFKPVDVVVLVTPMVIKGNAGLDHIMIGAELNVKPSEVDLSEFEEDISYIFQIDIKSLIVHETIHFQQDKADPKSLLGRAIKEGSADFLTELFLEQAHLTPAYEYGRKNEKELWLRFSKEMHSADYSKWLYASSKTDTRPMDLGYFVGYMITKSYYENSADKNKAIAEIIEVSDYEQFLKESGYGKQFYIEN